MPEILFDISHLNVKLTFDELDTVTWFVLPKYFYFASLIKFALVNKVVII